MSILTIALSVPLLILANTDADIKHDKLLQVPKERTVTVKQVVDGDTFITTDNEHVRIWGINAPEKNEAGYWSAGMFLDLKIRERKLLCRLIDKDRYSRLVMRCSRNNVDIGSYMVQTGYARDFTKYSNGFYKVDEDNAKEAKRGMWDPDSDISPDLKYTPY